MNMHLYRDAYEHALSTGDGSELRKFKHKVFITYDGPGLRDYHNKGVRVYPETNLKKIMAKRNSMTARERTRFDADRNYRKLEIGRLMPCIFCGEYHPSALNRTMLMCANCRQAANPRRKHIMCPSCGQWQPRNNHHVDGRAVSDVYNTALRQLSSEATLLPENDMRPQTQLSRCFIQPIEEAEPVPFGGRGRKRRTWRDEIPPKMIELLRPWAHPYLIFDTETLTDARSGQQSKIIFWQERGLKYADRCNLFAEDALTVEAMDECWRQGVAYNPPTCTEEEIKTVKAYAKKHDLWFRDMNWFIKSVFYRQAMLNGYMPEPKMIIGHNLP